MYIGMEASATTWGIVLVPIFLNYRYYCSHPRYIRGGSPSRELLSSPERTIDETLRRTFCFLLLVLFIYFLFFCLKLKKEIDPNKAGA